MTVSLWIPPYLADTLGRNLGYLLRALLVPAAANANVKLEVGEHILLVAGSTLCDVGSFHPSENFQ